MKKQLFLLLILLVVGAKCIAAAPAPDSNDPLYEYGFQIGSKEGQKLNSLCPNNKIIHEENKLEYVDGSFEYVASEYFEGFKDSFLLGFFHGQIKQRTLNK